MFVVNMAWGLWNKIKNGLRKAGSWVKDRVIKPVVNTVVKPFKPAITAAISAFNPAAGAIAGKVMDTAEKISDEGWGAGARSAVGWAKSKFG